MPQIKSAKKRVRVTARQTVENRLHRTRSRTALKKVRTLLAAGDVKEAVATFTTAQKYLDKASKTNAVHPNAAARAKSRLAAAMKAAGNKDPLPAAAKVVTKPKKSAKTPVKAKAAPKAKPAAKTTPKTTTTAKPATKPTAKPTAKAKPAKK